MEVPATCACRSVSLSPPGLGAPQVGGGQGPEGRRVGKMQMEDGFLQHRGLHEGCSAQNKMSQVPREGPKEGESTSASWQSQ